MSESKPIQDVGPAVQATAQAPAIVPVKDPATVPTCCNKPMREAHFLSTPDVDTLTYECLRCKRQEQVVTRDETPKRGPSPAPAQAVPTPPDTINKG